MKMFALPFALTLAATLYLPTTMLLTRALLLMGKGPFIHSGMSMERFGMRCGKGDTSMTRALQRAALMLVACVFVTTIQAQEPVPTIQGNAPLIALGDFDFAAVHEWWAAELELGKGIADLMTDSLINDGTYRVLERRFLPSVLAERSLAPGPMPSDQSTTDQLPRVLAAEYLIVGSVTNFGLEKATRGGLGAFFSGVGGMGQEKGKAKVSITARVVSVATGEVVASVKAEGVSARTGLLLAGAGPGAFAGFGMGSSKFRETVLGEAAEIAVQRAVAQLVALKPRLVRRNDIGF